MIYPKPAGQGTNNHEFLAKNRTFQICIDDENCLMLFVIQRYLSKWALSKPTKSNIFYLFEKNENKTVRKPFCNGSDSRVNSPRLNAKNGL